MRRSLLALSLPMLLAACEGAPTCTPGARDCACDVGARCDDGLRCVELTCRASDRTPLVLDAPGARACDLVIEDGTREVLGARFEGATGTVVREAPLTAISWVAGADAQLAPPLLETLGEGGADVVVLRCFDGLGVEVEGASARVGG